ncbi:pyridoxamine 5'-phosphate oxidase family protein [Nocardioides jensenii]|uniref:pyridoxamine 5'-phosphate oxidase family protein n=1 Tax=Nocardioides jensenii TaxID=1843 RepID=UPI00082F58EB|nr:pyridoxamine 5'-phosphate oxidase family protein [Nocardioides jensenii]
MDMPRELSQQECLQLLSHEEVARVAVCTPTGPHIVPVNYVVVDDAIVFRTAPYSVLGTVGWSSPLALEVDHLDHELRRGWSVVATGHGETITDPDALSTIAGLADLQPWAGGSRHLYIRLPWVSLTGRSVGGTTATGTSA